MADTGAPWFFSSNTQAPAGPRAPPGEICPVCQRADMHLAMGPAGSVHCWPVPVHSWAAAAVFPAALFGELGLAGFVAIYDRVSADGDDPSPGNLPENPINLD